ncbi:hypothetical protein LY78DRAFT_657020 [Colletotrichum sublineola]|nr:hypothetical protein LY78DRAFT_657020 [Colletotrichum sublineola]
MPCLAAYLWGRFVVASRASLLACTVWLSATCCHHTPGPMVPVYYLEQAGQKCSGRS